ncbi:MAG: winged helix-turn-helix domain-containing protein [Thermoplasmatota archaeon]
MAANPDVATAPTAGEAPSVSEAILRSLDASRKTPRELAAALGVAETVVQDGLDRLGEAGWVEGLEEDPPWVFWQLTWRGRYHIHGDAMTGAVLLSGAGGALVTAAVLAGSGLPAAGGAALGGVALLQGLLGLLLLVAAGLGIAGWRVRRRGSRAAMAAR